MVTRSIVRFRSRSEIILLVHHNYDGYLSGTGNDICYFLTKQSHITNGLDISKAYLSYCEQNNYSFKTYYDDIDDESITNFDVEWVYDIYYDKEPLIKIIPPYDFDAPLFSGTAEQTEKWILEKENMRCDECKVYYFKDYYLSTYKKMMRCVICDFTKCDVCDYLSECDKCHQFVCEHCYSNIECIECGRCNCNHCEQTDNIYEWRCNQCVLKNAVSFIQLRWRWIICRPDYKVCKNRLLNEFSVLST